MQGGNYFGVMGATLDENHPIDPSGKDRVCNCPPSSGACSHGGLIAANGVFYPHSKTRIRDIFDGSSNTIVIGEQSDWGYSPGGICPDPSCAPRLAPARRMGAARRHLAHLAAP